MKRSWCILALIVLISIAYLMVPRDTEIGFSKPSGVYAVDETSIKLNIPFGWMRGFEIYYTTDCSRPSKNNGILYSGPITIYDRSDDANILLARNDMSAWQDGIQIPVDKATVIRAVAYDRSGQEIDEACHTYWLGADEGKSYEGDLPLLSIVCDDADLTSYDEGILVRGQVFDYWYENTDDEDRLLADQRNIGDRNIFANYRMRDDEWERKAYINYLDQGKLKENRVLGIKVRGRATSEGIQKGFNLYAREDYDGESLLPDSITGIGYGSRSISLKRANSVYESDIVISKQISELEAGGQVGKLVQVFINGEWWGVYTTLEKYNNDYFDHHFRVDTRDDNVVLIKSGKTTEENEAYLDEFEDLLEWTTYNDMEEDYSWISLNALVDVDSAIDYYAIQTYIDNTDTDDMWNNIIWRTKEIDTMNPYADGRWRYCLYDMDASRLDYKQDTLHLPISEYNQALGDNLMLKAILGNKEGREKFYSRLVELRDTVFAYEKMNQYCVDEAEPVYKLLEEQYQWRKLAGWNDDEPTRAVLDKADEFWQKRGDYVLDFAGADMN